MSILSKPVSCQLCPCRGKPGFVPDPELGDRDPVGLVMMTSPFQEDTYKARALGGAMGWVLETKWGIHRADFAWTYLLRCYQGAKFPVGKARGDAVKRCREYDEAVKEFKPDTFLVTFDFRDALDVPPYRRLIQRDFERLRWLRAQGARPMMLMGKEVVHEFAPWLLGKGGIKAVRGHWWEEELAA